MTEGLFDQWIGRHCGISGAVTPEAVENYQLAALRRQAAYAAEHSRFYRALYAGYDLDDPLSLPLISSADIVAAGSSVVCLPQREIKRIVSMMTSGSTASRSDCCCAGVRLRGESPFACARRNTAQSASW